LSPYEVIYRNRRLLSLGEPALAFDFATIYAGDLPDRDRVALLLDALAARGDETGRRNLIDRVLRAGIDGPSLDLLVAHLIRHPSFPHYEQCREHLQRAVAMDPRQRLPAFFAVAGIHRDTATLEQLGELAQATATLPADVMTSSARFLLNPRSRNVGTLLLMLRPLGVDTTYALLEYYESRP